MNHFWPLKSWIKVKINRLTARTSKTAIAVLSAVIFILVLSVSVSKSVRFFCWERPGILIVVIAVLGEVICHWNRKKYLRERLKKCFGMQLVGGLRLEIVEGVKSDEATVMANREAKQAEDDAEQAGEHVAALSNETVRLSLSLGESAASRETTTVS